MKSEEVLEFDTKLTADVVVWKPSSTEIVLACGTYQLDKELNQRLGYFYLIEIDPEQNKMNVLNTVNYENSGILDMKWTDQEHLITIDSNNNLKYFFYEKENHSIELLNELNLDQSKDTKSIGLTLDFLKVNESQLNVLTSDTLGNLSLTQIDNHNMNEIRKFKAHDYEVWSVLIDKNDPNIIYSGADDCLLKMWDIREPEHRQASKCGVFEGGVCSIIHLQRNDDLSCLSECGTHNLLCGSYDERIHVLDKRNLKHSIKQSKKLDGGVWKMKINSERNLVLCACMHTGVHLVDLNTLESKFYYDKHGLNNLAYGCDWCPSKIESEQNSDLIATCSFYNHSLRVWKLIQ
jgi:diphthamide biosynthesis protein 7